MGTTSQGIRMEFLISDEENGCNVNWTRLPECEFLDFSKQSQIRVEMNPEIGSGHTEKVKMLSGEWSVEYLWSSADQSLKGMLNVPLGLCVES